ncbi:MAG: class I SAM-dependent DNA methyltransferase [Fimbriimonadaceae bacterium]
MSDFEAIAPFYDELMGSIPYDAWAEYFLELCAKAGSKPKSVLEIGCGTGKLAEKLISLGLAVDGVDPSAGMCKQAQINLKQHGSMVVTASAAEFELKGRYDAALSFFDSLNNILDPEEFRASIANVASHLNPGGVFIFDLNTEYAFKKKLWDQHDHSKKSRVRYDWTSEYDPGTKLVEIHMHFWVDGEKVRALHTQRAYSRPEVENAIHAAGFKFCEVFHSDTLCPPRKTSDRLHYLCYGLNENR